MWIKIVLTILLILLFIVISWTYLVSFMFKKLKEFTEDRK